MSILASLSGPRDLRALDDSQLDSLCAEIRRTIIETVAVTGGHLGSSLGVVELTVALHRLLESPRDRIVWDTGHQAYPHKLLTGRLERFSTLRQLGGVGGFPRRSESEHDVLDGGHAGTGLSIAQGLAAARDLRGTHERIVAVVGDAALMSGLALEALNDIGQRQTNLLIVLNDNEMSISPTVGALSNYLSRDQAVGGVADHEGRVRRGPGAAPDGGKHGGGALAPDPQVGRELRAAAGPALRGPRHHVHRGGARPRPGGPDIHVPARAPASRGRSSSTSGPRRATATSRPRWTRWASTAPPCLPCTCPASRPRRHLPRRPTATATRPLRWRRPPRPHESRARTPPPWPRSCSRSRPTTHASWR